MYRFLLTRRWIGLALLLVLAAVVMVGLGVWQKHRYQYRTDLNARIDAAAKQPPVSLDSVLTPPSGGVGPAPADNVEWSVVSVTGRYDATHEIIARIRTVNSDLGFEIITPLVLDNGSAVLIDRGFLTAGDTGATKAPSIPTAPTGTVTVVGRVHSPESRADAPTPFDGHLAVRRIGPAQIAAAEPYPLYGGYLLLQNQTPAADPAFVPIPVDYENATMNAGYVLQWWAFAILTIFGFGYMAYRHAHPLAEATAPAPEPDASVAA